MNKATKTNKPKQYKPLNNISTMKQAIKKNKYKSSKNNKKTIETMNK